MPITPVVSSGIFEYRGVIEKKEETTGNVNMLRPTQSNGPPNHCDPGNREEEIEKLANELPEPLRQMYVRGMKHLEDDQQIKLKELIEKHIPLFSKSKLDIGKATRIKHSIITGNSPPLSQPLRRLPIHHQEEANKQVNEMFEAGVIEKSISPWSCCVVLVEKKDGTQIFCIDFRQCYGKIQ
jgi:hypothetical protein